MGERRTRRSGSALQAEPCAFRFVLLLEIDDSFLEGHEMMFHEIKCDEVRASPAHSQTNKNPCAAGIVLASGPFSARRISAFGFCVSVMSGPHTSS